MGTDNHDQIAANKPAVPEAMRYLAVVMVVSAVLATLFTAWKPASLNPAEVVGNWLELAVSGEPTEVAGLGENEEDRQPRVGIIAGHSGINPSLGLEDPGATCEDGLTEVQVNQSIANLVVKGLEEVGIQVDLMEEFDERLYEYRADALVSIHADSCYWINEEATGYKVSQSAVSTVPDLAQRLVVCVVDRYGRATDLRYHPRSITRDMTEYHSFLEIHSQTPAAIIETGFLYLDRDFLTEQPQLAALGIVDGILCYLNQEPVVPSEDVQ